MMVIRVVQHSIDIPLMLVFMRLLRLRYVPATRVLKLNRGPLDSINHVNI